MSAASTTIDIFLSERGDDKRDCTDPEMACRTLRRAMQVADDGGRVVVHVDTVAHSTSGWLCLEETVQVHGSVTIKPRPRATSKTARLGCGNSSGFRRVLKFNVTGTRGRSEASLTLERLTVEGVILKVRDGHVTMVESTLLDVSLISNDDVTDYVGIDVINSTWTSRYPNNLTTCEVTTTIVATLSLTAELSHIVHRSRICACDYQDRYSAVSVIDIDRVTIISFANYYLVCDVATISWVYIAQRERDRNNSSSAMLSAFGLFHLHVKLHCSYILCNK